MSLKIASLKLENFRNHSLFELNNPKNLIIIIGRNASGKTNIIEALQLITMMESFKGSSWANTVLIGKNTSCIKAKFLQNGRQLEIKVQIESGRRQYFLNDKKKNISDLISLIPGVIFVPEDLNIVKKSAEIRRNMIDDIGKQLSKSYFSAFNDYKKIIKQRNLLLKEIKEGLYNKLVLQAYNDSLIHVGAALFVFRYKMYKELIKRAAIYYENFLKSESLTTQYIPSFYQHLNINDQVETSAVLERLTKKEVEELLQKLLTEVQDTEIVRTKSLVGPHTDDIKFFISGLEARTYASQGQQRSIALSIKLAQLEIIKENCGNHPILLLDDVMSELDESRRETLIKTIDGHVQTVITATDLKCIDKNVVRNAQIIELDT